MKADTSALRMPLPAVPDTRFALGRQVATWGLVAAVMIVLPMLFTQGFSLSMLSQMGIAVIFALSYNMLLGQTGMLSFGHAVHFGLGSFVCAHALNRIGAGEFGLPVTLIPLVGGFAGLAFGIVFGYVTTKRSGTPFAMISLGIAEMVAASALMFPGFFGGEGGITTNRVLGDPVMGVSYGPQIEVYYLIAGWCLACMIAMFALTQTPLGRMANAVRDNAERVRFVGYNPTRVRYWMFCLASFFAGIAGGLATINYEIVTAETLGLMASGNVLVMAFVGGVGHFFGPVIGAVLVSFLQSALSTYTKAWLLYFGLFFVMMVLFAPGGIASLFAVHGAPLRHGLFRRLIPGYLLSGVCLLVMVLGFVALVEMLYHVEQGADMGTEFDLFGLHIDVTGAASWLAAGAVFIAGLVLFVLTLPVIRRAWTHVHGELQARDAA
ncbi:MAG: branched-chain amino acid ABC transporter permease [Burkholderiales bacterium]|nr:branched-chain amino acid ABC transporter permease [Burkholderiales bacterium]